MILCYSIVDVYMKANEKFLMRSLPYLLIIASVRLSIQLFNSNPTTYAENLDRYWSILTGDQQTPPVTTDAIGYVGLKFQDDRTKLAYSVHAEHIGKVTAVYLYQIDKEQNGTIVLDLLHSPRELKSIDKVVDKTPQGKTKGTVSMGGAISDDLQGQMKGKTLSDLHKLIDNGTVYISIHTKDFPTVKYVEIPLLGLIEYIQILPTSSGSSLSYKGIYWTISTIISNEILIIGHAN